MNSMINANNGLAINQVVSRQMQEVQGAIIMAKQFPRDVNASLDAIMAACRNRRVAESAEYVFPRDGQDISGASIRLAEVVAQAWGNIDYGIIELSSSNGVSEMMAYAWDIQANVRRQMIFSVRHERTSKKRGTYKLTDSRDVYEVVANMGSRRVRACILAVIPAYVVDEAREECKKYLESELGKDGRNGFEKEIKITISTFERKMGIPAESLEKYLGKSRNQWDLQDMISIRSVYSSIKEGMAGKADFFPELAEPEKPETVEETERAAEQLNEQLGLVSEVNENDVDAR